MTIKQYMTTKKYRWNHLIFLAGNIWAGIFFATGLAPDVWHAALLGFVVAHTFK